MNLFLEGLILGYAYAMPIGPQNLFVIDSALKSTKRQALVTALVVGLMDVSLAFGCFWGIGLLIRHSPLLKSIMLGLGTAFLVVLSVKLMMTKTVGSDVDKPKITGRLLSIIQLCFILTWLNPQALIDGSLLFGGYSAKLSGASPIAFLGGMTTASFSWFFILTAVISTFRSKLSFQFIRTINVACGILMLLLGLKMGINFINGVTI